MTEFFLTGLILGLSAGMAPGPLMTLVLTETLQHDAKAGIKMAMAPLFTDLPIIVATLLILSQLADSKPILGIISLLGAAFLWRMGWHNLRTHSLEIQASTATAPSILKGIMANFLSPNPYLFWMTVGGAYLSRTVQHGTTASMVFLVVFYICLIGTKAGVAILTAKAKGFASQPALLNTFRILGLLLCGMGLELLWEGLRLLQLI